MSNRLADATSPYLQQHADNPVDWYPWGEEALERARGEDKPILLSIGYSACHWCHVMAHESFEDPAVAAAMNALFVNIKVDREERPDLDQIYQTAHALLTQRSGGWPLTMFLTPEGTPFFAGTYFPKAPRHGLPGFADLLPRVADAYAQQRDQLLEQNRRLHEALASLEPRADSTPGVPADAGAQAFAYLKRTFDPRHGGFGAAPKFPHPAELEFCLRMFARNGDASALEIVRTTLARMAEGGIHDQLGGGFCRYSVDAEWTIPHFEKMLYDNGPLLALYADLARVTGERRFADVARNIVGWLTREMQAPDGAFYSSLDADSEGDEGKFYVWTREAARVAVSADEWAVAQRYYGLDRPANFEGETWNLRVALPLADVAADLGITTPDASTRLAGARSALFAVRERRVHPARDDKILTAWNALAIAGLARAGRALEEPRWIDLAFGAADALKRCAWRDGRLVATRRGNRADLNAYLDDHAFLIDALLELMQARFRVEDFEWALALADRLLAGFEDREHGGFFFTSHDHEMLFHRPKPGHDSATPSGNGIAARSLVVLGHLAGRPAYVEAAARTLGVFAAEIADASSGHATLLEAWQWLESPPAQVLLRGVAPVCAQWQATLEVSYRPDVQVFNLAQVASLPAALAKGPAPGQGAVAFVCRNMTCLPAMYTLDEVGASLEVAAGR